MSRFKIQDFPEHVQAQIREQLADYYATWERLRDNAFSESEKHEIDEIFSRQLP